jgi:hypothetical protein
MLGCIKPTSALAGVEPTEQTHAVGCGRATLLMRALGGKIVNRSHLAKPELFRDLRISQHDYN